MRRLVIYVHGKGGNAEESKHYEPIFADSDVIGFDYKSQNPWEAEVEFSDFFDLHAKEYDFVVLIANSIGAFFSMSALAEKKISQAMLISPIVDMEKLITDMMMWENVTENALQSRREIPTKFGETLSWEYLSYVRNHPIEWSIPTSILYGENDNLTSRETISAFADKIGASITVMNGGEHWFHTDEQMSFLDGWIIESIKLIDS
jgi:pimeloyl-ACP methyl ester carboxylesterase